MFFLAIRIKPTTQQVSGNLVHTYINTATIKTYQKDFDGRMNVKSILCLIKSANTEPTYVADVWETWGEV